MNPSREDMSSSKRERPSREPKELKRTKSEWPSKLPLEKLKLNKTPSIRLREKLPKLKPPKTPPKLSKSPPLYHKSPKLRSLMSPLLK